jgi:hypothetical protein
MFIQNFSSLTCTQTDLYTFLTIFKENSRIFEENSRIFQANFSAHSKKFQMRVCNLLFNLAKHVHAEFQLSTLYPDGLRQIFDLFSRIIQEFFKENLEFSKSEKSTE